MPPRAVAASLACVLLVGIAGRGVGAGAGEADVQAAVSSYIPPSAAGSGEQACAYSAPALRREFDRKARENGLTGCTDLLAPPSLAALAAARRRPDRGPGGHRRPRQGRGRHG